MHHVTVISTGWAPHTASLCVASVARQQGVEVDHRIVDASKQAHPLTKLENIYRIIETLSPNEIVAMVDLDDWLAHRGALARIAEEHESGSWVTYGQFVQSDSTPGFAAAYPVPDYRGSPWLATHLKTIRAGLFQRIRSEDLFFDGEWIDRADDPAFMFPCLEMAGADRVKFISDVIYVYSAESRWELTAPPEDLERERAIVEHVRGLPIYERLEAL